MFTAYFLAVLTVFCRYENCIVVTKDYILKNKEINLQNDTHHEILRPLECFDDDQGIEFVEAEQVASDDDEPMDGFQMAVNHMAYRGRVCAKDKKLKEEAEPAEVLLENAKPAEVLLLVPRRRSPTLTILKS